MAGNGTPTAKQLRLIQVLLTGARVPEAAKQAGVSERTAWRWLGDPVFDQAYNEARKQMLNHSLASLQTKFDKAIGTLDRHLDNAKTIPRDQLKSAEIVISTTIQTAQLLERIAELEALVVSREQEELYIVKFDLRKVTPDERETLRRVNASIVSRENQTLE